MKFVLGATAHNTHVQNMARAFHEADALYAYVTGGVDSYRSGLLRAGRRAIAMALPRVDRELSRRAVVGLPPDRVRARWQWELPRVAASRLGLDERVVDWLWEREELALDSACARLLKRRAVHGFFGVEYGALASLAQANAVGKPGVVAFLSPHHRTLAKWVGREYEAWPELRTDGSPYFAARDAHRNERRDREAEAAAWIVTGSSFTTQSMIDAGFPRQKMITVPLGGPVPVSPNRLPNAVPDVFRVAYVGPVSVRKGAHYLLRAWSRIARPGMELHFYGKVLLPDGALGTMLDGTRPGSVVVHGSIPAADLSAVYLNSSVLVLPTLCDGFGQVVSDALAHGLPAITTHNAGAADAIEEGRNGFVIPPADETALAEKLEWCVEHQAELLEMRRAALASAALWTWAHFRQRFIDLALGAIAKPRAAVEVSMALKPSATAGVR